MTTTKRNTAITATISESEGSPRLTLSFAHGKKLTLDPSELSSEIVRVALLHGLKQKLVDAAAISRNPETGRSATIDDKFAAVHAVYERLLRGEWNAVREGGATTGGMLLQALCRLYPAKTPDTLRAYLSAKSDAEKTALRKNPRVAAIIEEIRAESGKAASVDTDALLDELEDGEE